MKLEDQVCTLEQAKKLRELGVTVYGLFIHIENLLLPSDCHIKYFKETASFKDFYKVESKGTIKYYPALSVAELGQTLPVASGMRFFESHYNDHLGEWGCQFRGFKTVEAHNDWDWSVIPPLIHETEGETEAQARADMLIFLLENKLITPEEVNQRLNS